jgi:hypothetical protein
MEKDLNYCIHNYRKDELLLKISDIKDHKVTIYFKNVLELLFIYDKW